MANFKVIIDGGYQILQSPGGEHINYLIKTNITQDTEKPGICRFWLNVTAGGEKYCRYDEKTGVLTTPKGEILPVEVVVFTPCYIHTIDQIICDCKVDFPYDTNHERHA